MKCQHVVAQAQQLYCLGDLNGAEKKLDSFLNRKRKNSWFTENAQAYLWLGVIHRLKGSYSCGKEIHLQLAQAEETDVLIRANAQVELAICYQHSHDQEEAHLSLERARTLLDTSLPPGESIAHDKAMVHYLGFRGVFEMTHGMHQHSLESLGNSIDYIIAIGSQEEFSKPLITAYLNLSYCHMIIGNIEQAQNYLLLAHAKMQQLETPFAYGLIQFFEHLATYNLFAAGSQRETISALSHISEKVVVNFADFRKVFDFFSSIIVQLHEGKIDLEEIREQIRAYGDDPLIKAYLPVLLTGAPPPGSGDGDDDIPSARLAD